MLGKPFRGPKMASFGSISVTHIELIPDVKFSHAAWANYHFPPFKIFRNLPCLKSIRGKGIGGISIEDGCTYYDTPSKASDVCEILLKQRELSGGCASNIIGFSTGLEAFTYRFGGRASIAHAVVYTPELAKALTQHNSTIRSLDIDIDKLLHWSLEEEIQRWTQGLKTEKIWR
jgi:hypothetical protein